MALIPRDPNIPEPRALLTVEEFLSTLDKDNTGTDELRTTFRIFGESVRRIYRKDEGLCGVVVANLYRGRFPIIDKVLGVVLELVEPMPHEQFVKYLFQYHTTKAGNDPYMYDDRIWSQLYIENAYGYYFSTCWGYDKHTPLISNVHYKPDRYDKDLLIHIGLG